MDSVREKHMAGVMKTITKKDYKKMDQFYQDMFGEGEPPESLKKLVKKIKAGKD